MAKLEYPIPCGLPVIFHPSQPARLVTGSAPLKCHDEAKRRRTVRLVGQGHKAEPFSVADEPGEVVFAWTPAGKRMIAGDKITDNRRQF